MLSVRSLLVLSLLVVASGVAAGAVAISAEPDEGTVTVGQPVTWQGSVELFSNGNVCQPPISSGSPTCDEFTLTADIDEKYWESFDGGAELEFLPTGSDPTVNLNVEVYDADGTVVATGASAPPPGATTPASEQVMIPEASRAGSPYSVVVYNNTTGFVGRGRVRRECAYRVAGLGTGVRRHRRRADPDRTGLRRSLRGRACPPRCSRARTSTSRASCRSQSSAA